MTCHLRNLQKSFDDNTVLRSVSFTLSSNHRYALCGASGTGKTTLLRVLCGLEPYDAGQLILEEDVRFSYAFQEPRLFPHLSIRDNILLLEPKHSPDEILCLLNLSESASKLPSELSGGMKKRASLARALAVDADIYLIDEPTAGQDMEHIRRITEAIRLFTAGKITVIASHNEEFIQGIADQRIILHDGRAVLSEV